VGREGQAPRSLDELLRVDVAVVHAIDARPLERQAAPLGEEVPAARVHQDAERVAAVDRHQLVAQLVVGRVQRHRQVDREVLLGEAADARHDAHRRHREVAR
jgi:hypothetical protein